MNVIVYIYIYIYIYIYSVELFDDKRIKNWKECGHIGRGLEAIFWHLAEEIKKITKILISIIGFLSSQVQANLEFN